MAGDVVNRTFYFTSTFSFAATSWCGVLTILCSALKITNTFKNKYICERHEQHHAPKPRRGAMIITHEWYHPGKTPKGCHDYSPCMVPSRKNPEGVKGLMGKLIVYKTINRHLSHKPLPNHHTIRKGMALEIRF